MALLRLGSSSLGVGFGLLFLLIVESNTYLSPPSRSGGFESVDSIGLVGAGGIEPPTSTVSR